MAAEQMERSLLEGKERDELALIAQTLGVKVGVRSKKESLVDSILQATGVAGGADSAKPVASERSTATADRVDKKSAPSRGRGRGRGESTADATTADDNNADESSASPARKTASLSESGELIILPDASPTPPTEGARDNSRNNNSGNTAGNNDGQNGDAQNAEGGRNDRGERWERGRGRNGRRDRNGRRPESEAAQWTGETVDCVGYLEMRDEGFGFLRTKGFMPSPKDVYISIGMVRKYGLRKGDYVEGGHKPITGNEKFPALVRVDKVAGMDVEEARSRPRFEDLTPLFPDVKLKLETPNDPRNITGRIIDLICPIGKGQRGLIVSPPKAGKTTIMKQIAQSIEANNPEVILMVLLVDERPEEVTDMRRSIQGEVIASTFDRPSDEHTALAELAIERAKRLVEMGKDVVIILDGITRLARAYNIAAPATGRIMSGGIDTGALYPPKKFFGAARNVEEGGSLTILATALVETGSKMDEVIFEEFKGTGNMELRLDRRLAERRIYPALDPNSSSTRHEELLIDQKSLQQIWKLRRVLNGMGDDGTSSAALQLLLDKLKSTKTNDEFIADIAATNTTTSN
jgi:transcription termination factor Rho